MSNIKRIWQTFLDFTVPASRAAFSVLLSTITYLTVTLGAVGLAITFTNAAAGQSGNIKFVNGSNHTITAHADVAINADVLSTISASGTYHLSYYCSAASGNDTILVSASAILT